MSERFESLQSWLKIFFGTSDYELKPVSGDASLRTYFRVFVEGNSFIVMDAPPEHEDCEAFINITHKLQDVGINVPGIHSENISQGFLLLTDLGNNLYLDYLNLDSTNSLYGDAINALVKIQAFADTDDLRLYDEDLLRREIGLFTDWLVERHLDIHLGGDDLKGLESVFDLLVENALVQPQVFVHRDFHSRNLMLTPKNNPGVIDYQDAVRGPISYDLVSLLRDCYIKWPVAEMGLWLDTYITEYNRVNPDIPLDQDQFRRWFDLTGVQRHLKASGIFARLSHRDGKHGFLKDVPRTLSYIIDLKMVYPELSVLIKFMEGSVLPRLKGE